MSRSPDATVHSSDRTVMNMPPIRPAIAPSILPNVACILRKRRPNRIQSAVSLVVLLVLATVVSSTCNAQVVPASATKASDSTASGSTAGAPDAVSKSVPPELRASQNFVITTRIFEGQSDQPIAQHRWVFDGGVVYDFDKMNDDRISIFDPASESVSMIDKSSKTQTLVSTRELIKICAGAKAAAQTDAQRDALGLDAKIVPSDRLDGVAIQFSGIQYDVSAQEPEHAWMSKDFARYSDIAFRLNFLLRQGVPPFARMTIGEDLARQGKLPHQTYLTIRRKNQTQAFRSVVKMEKITGEDKNAIGQAKAMSDLLKQVPLQEFVKQD